MKWFSDIECRTNMCAIYRPTVTCFTRNLLLLFVMKEVSSFSPMVEIWSNFSFNPIVMLEEHLLPSFIFPVEYEKRSANITLSTPAHDLRVSSCKDDPNLWSFWIEKLSIIHRRRGGMNCAYACNMCFSNTIQELPQPKRFGRHCHSCKH